MSFAPQRPQGSFGDRGVLLCQRGPPRRPGTPLRRLRRLRGGSVQRAGRPLQRGWSGSGSSRGNTAGDESEEEAEEEGEMQLPGKTSTTMRATTTTATAMPTRTFLWRLGGRGNK